MKFIFHLTLITSLFFFACTNKKNVISLPKEEKIAEEKSENTTTENKQNVKNETNAAVATDNLQNQAAPIIIGNVITENQSSLAFLNSGTIDKVYARAGDFVKKGQIIASLINTQEMIDLRAAELRLKQKELALALEKKKFNRIIDQFKNGIINKATVENEKNNLDSLALDFETGQNDLQGKKYNLQMTKIIAPYDGVISQKNKSVGDFVPAGTIVFQITQNKNMEIYAQIPGIYIDKLKPGMKLTIVSQKNQNETGEIVVRKIIPVLDKNSRSFDFYGQISHFKTPLTPGDFVEIKL